MARLCRRGELPGDRSHTVGLEEGIALRKWLTAEKACVGGQRRRVS